jgi:hypothetical protein
MDFVLAGDHGYCRTRCAKCYSQFVWDFIEPMERERGTLPKGYSRGMFWADVMNIPGIKEHLAEELESLPLLDFLKLEHWDRCLCLAFEIINDQQLHATILREWIKMCPDSTHFVDLVVFYLLPHVDLNSDLTKEWTERAIKLAITTKDPSLVESLIWRLKANAKVYPDFISLANEMRTHSPAIEKAMNASTVRKD